MRNVRFIVESKRLLKTGGKLVIRTPNTDAFGRNYFGLYWYANDVPRHIFLFNKKNLQMLFKRHGLKPLKQKTFASPKIFLNSWDLLKKNQGTASKKKTLHRLIARIFALYAGLTHQGDEIFAIYEKK